MPLVARMTQLKHDLKNGVLTLTLDRPVQANALTLEMVRDLQDSMNQASIDQQIRVILITGAGGSFSSGHDINEMLVVRDEKVSYGTHLRATYNPLILQIRRIEKPVVAAINGPAAGAGLGIALACDLRMAAASATFTVGFNAIGLVPDSGVSLFLPLLVGIGRAEEFTFNNMPISAARALDWGLVNYLVPDESLRSESTALVTKLAAGPVGAYGLTKKAFNNALLGNLEHVLEQEAQLQENASKNLEHQQGIRAFLEKRPANFL